MKRTLIILLALMLCIACTLPALAEYKIHMTRESTAAIKGYSTLKKGSKGQKVRDMQERLAELGYMEPCDVDGSYGNGTRDAVYAFQTNNMLTGADGIAYPYTQYKLYDVTAIPAWGISGATLSIGDSGLEVLRLEKRLCDTAYLDDDDVDGVYDSATEIAVLAFQVINGTECCDGVACLDTLELLYSYQMHSFYK